MIKFRFLFLVIVFSVGLFAQSVPPKREFRAVWIATVGRIDWPKSNNPATQRSDLISILDAFKSLNINAFMFQVRPECDALYQSDIEPWSRWLTGTQGVPPNPFYDPLEFAINEAHKRGMELHAWLNPYRAERVVGSYPLSSNHVVKKHPEWILQVGNLKFLNPGLQEVRDYVTSVFVDIVSRYDVDGIHIDDYFYGEGITTQDAATFAAYPRGFTNIADWRRDNINLLIKQVNDSIQAIKPWVKWGVSPRGIWRPGYPPGIVGNDNYNSIYTDAMHWLQSHSIDYINPQLYWKFGGGQDYGKLMPWWADSAGANGRHMYVGHAVYRINDGTSNFTASELPNQIRLNRVTPNCQGSVHYNTNTLLSNPKGFLDSLRNDFYKYPALPPVMDWKDITPPQPVANLNASVSSSNVTVTWQKPSAAPDGDSAYYYVIYRFDNQTPVNIDDPRYIRKVDYSGTFSFTENNVISGSTVTATYVVTSVDRLHNESAVSSITVDENGVVPVELSSFTAVLNKSKVELNWVTATETNNYGFELERKADDEWRTIGFVEGNGTSSEEKYYSFTDDLSSFSSNQKIFYRIKQIDLDGTFKYSEIVNVDYSPLPLDFVLEQNFPNPFNPSTKIKYSVPEFSHVQIIVYDALGTETAVLVNEQKQPGTYELNFEGQNLSSGVYIYRLKANGNILSRKMLLMK